MAINNLANLLANKELYPFKKRPSDLKYYLSPDEYNTLLTTIKSLINDYNEKIEGIGPSSSISIIKTIDTTEPSETTVFSSAATIAKINEKVIIATPVKGVDYKDGKDGKTPVKGVDYNDGITPVKGIDYKDGKDGKTPVKGVDYDDGITPVKGVHYNDGITPVKGVDYKDGKDGKTPIKGVDYNDGITPAFRYQGNWVQYSYDSISWINLFEVLVPSGSVITPPSENPARNNFITTYNATAGKNLVKDPTFRRKANWNIESEVYHRREDGQFITPAHQNIDKKKISQVLNLEVGTTYYYSVDIKTTDVIEEEGKVGGVIIHFTDTSFVLGSVKVLGTQNFTNYSGTFVANSPTSIFSMEGVNIHTSSTVGYGEVRFRNPAVSKTPITDLIFYSQAEVLIEAKIKYPLNADWGLPELTPNRTYTPSGPAFYGEQSNFVVDGLQFKDVPEDAIYLWNCHNVIIRNCDFTNVIAGKAIQLLECTNITIIYNNFHNIHRAVNAQQCGEGIKVDYNHVNKIAALMPDHANIIQFNGVVGRNCSISHNSIDNGIGILTPCDDQINLFASSGTPDSWIQVVGNWIRGGGYERSGAGIIGGDNDGQYQLIKDNILYEASSGGIGAGGGSNLSFINNTLYSKRRDTSRAAGVFWQWDIARDGLSTNITIENNSNNWRNENGQLSNGDFGEETRAIVPNWATTAMLIDTDINETILPPNIFVRFPV